MEKSGRDSAFRQSNSKIVLLSARHPFSSSGLGAQMEKFQFCKPVGEKNPEGIGLLYRTLWVPSQEKGKKKVLRRKDLC